MNFDNFPPSSSLGYHCCHHCDLTCCFICVLLLRCSRHSAPELLAILNSLSRLLLNPSSHHGLSLSHSQEYGSLQHGLNSCVFHCILLQSAGLQLGKLALQHLDKEARCRRNWPFQCFRIVKGFGLYCNQH